MEDVFVLSGVRTPIGKYGGGLASVPPCDLAALMVREAVKRSGTDPVDVGHVMFGNVIHTEPRDMYLARVAAINGGLESRDARAHREPAVRQSGCRPSSRRPRRSCWATARSRWAAEPSR